MTSIEWVKNADGSQGKTWNPIVGCSIVSPGCTNCYAMKMAARIEAMGNQPRYAGTTKKVKGNAVWTGKLAQAPESTLLQPLKRHAPTTYFVNSMGDLFHEDCPDEWIDKVFAVMALAPQHTFQVLTKRAARMRDYMTRLHDEPTVDTLKRIVAAWPGNTLTADITIPLPNVWLGVSTERQQEADERIPLLMQTPAAVRFISAEPLLGPLSLRWAKWDDWSGADGEQRETVDHLDGLRMLDWVIVGGESGPGSRVFQMEWAREIVEQCAEAGIPCFVKQVGAKPTLNGSPFGLQFSRKGGDPDEWPAYLNVREMPSAISA
jgi:protein gp37